MKENKQQTEYTTIFSVKYVLSITETLILPLKIIFFIIGMFTLYTGLLARPDIIQGEYYKIIFIHVPASWMSILLYIKLAVESIIFIITYHPVALISAKITAQIGIVFTFISLVTGSLWGVPIWGTYWVFDARLTSVLVLFFLYLSYLILIRIADKNIISNIIPSYLSVFGLLNIPVIKFSTDYFNTLHQPSSISEYGSTIDIMTLVPLFSSFFALILFTTIIYFYKLRISIIDTKTYNIQKYVNNQ